MADPSIKNCVSHYVALSGTGETTLWGPDTETAFAITDIIVSAGSESTVTFRDGTAGSTILLLSMQAKTSQTIHLQTPIISGTHNNALTGQASAATAYVTVVGYEIR
jgi:hypothetical protein